MDLWVYIQHLSSGWVEWVVLCKLFCIGESFERYPLATKVLGSVRSSSVLRSCAQQHQCFFQFVYPETVYSRLQNVTIWYIYIYNIKKKHRQHPAPDSCSCDGWRMNCLFNHIKNPTFSTLRCSEVYHSQTSFPSFRPFRWHLATGAVRCKAYAGPALFVAWQALCTLGKRVQQNVQGVHTCYRHWPLEECTYSIELHVSISILLHSDPRVLKPWLLFLSWKTKNKANLTTKTSSQKLGHWIAKKTRMNNIRRNVQTCTPPNHQQQQQQQQQRQEEQQQQEKQEQ